MRELWAAINANAATRGDESALLVFDTALETAYTWKQLQRAVRRLIWRLRQDRVRVLALAADNVPAWVIADIACGVAGITLLPLPGFFAAGQLRHALDTVPVDALLHDATLPDAVVAAQSPEPASSQTLLGLHYRRLERSEQALAARADSLPEGTSKITFTSGSTGTPKGACLSAAHLEAVASSIVAATQSCQITRHLCVLPLATLLENVAGVHAPLRRGAAVVLVPQQRLGFNGASGFSLPAFLDVLAHCRPQSLILIPQLLEALVMSAASGWKLPDSLRFVAVGGASVNPLLLERAWQFGIPAFEGYGLSECGSVVSLNTPGQRRNGSLGRPLPHVRVAIHEGEIQVFGPRFLGYAGDKASWLSADDSAPLATGDLGYQDNDGYLHFNGRRKNLLVSSFGRNISPEWVETQLAASPCIAQSIVFGDSRPYCVALVQARHARISDEDIDASIAAINAALPDYARVQRWARLNEPLLRGSGLETDLLTSNGRPRRAQIAQRFAATLEALYSASNDDTHTPRKETMPHVL
jgi:long-subunit acyl-CoA synthetase (AMP-forming)